MPPGAADPAELACGTASPQAAGDLRPVTGDERSGPGTSGDGPGTNGVFLAWCVGAVIVAASTTVNVFSELHDHAGVAWWEPVVWEYSSGLSTLLWFVIPWRATVLARPGALSWRRLLAVHGLASLLFSAAHVATFVALRHAAYAVMGETYRFGPSVPEFLYEYRKDLLAYVAVVVMLWLVPLLLSRREPPKPKPDHATPAAPTYDIRDGARLVRVPTGEIIAATSAGNYVEFLLADGRRPLARATLSGVEAELGGCGLVRTHRSWLVNAARVRALTPEGSGDYAVELEGGVRVPLSRRFPAALALLRRPGVTQGSGPG